MYGYAKSKLNKGLFYCTTEAFYLFIQSLKVRADEYGCTYSTSGVLIIPSDYGTRTTLNENDPGNLRNIITNYDTIKFEDLIKHERIYVGQTTRRAQ